MAFVRVSGSTGGATYLAGGDINAGVRGWNELQTTVLNNEFVVDVQGEVEPVHWGVEYGGDIILYVAPRLGIGVGVSRLESSQTSELVAQDRRFLDLEFRIPNRVEVTAVPVRLGVFYTLPAGRRLNVVVNGGLGFYATDVSWNWRLDRVEAGSVTRATDLDTKASGAGVGYHGGVAVEYKLVKQVGVFLEVQGTYARVGGLEGTAEGTFSFGPSTTEEGLLYYSELEATGSLDRNLPVISIANEVPSSPELINVREAEVDLGGVRLMGGVTVRF